MKEPEQWAVKQHLEKYPVCEWICTHTKYENLGEELPDMEVYEPSTKPHFIVESDGDSWFAHDSTFINLVEDDRCFFAETPQEALDGFIEKFYEVELTEQQKKQFNDFLGGDPFDGFPSIRPTGQKE